MNGLTETHTAPLDGNEPESGHLTPRRFLIEWLLLSAALAVPYVAFGATVGAFASMGIISVYLNLPFPSRREQPKTGQHHGALLAVSGMFSGIAFLAILLIAWFFAAYDLRKVGIELEIPTELWIVIAAFILAAGAFAIGLYVMSLITLRRKGVISGRFVDFIRIDLISLPRSHFLIEGLSTGFGLTGGFIALVSTIAIERLADTLNQSSTTTELDLVRLIPTLPIGLLGLSALSAISMGRRQREPIILTRLEGEAGHPLWQGAVAAIGCFALIATLFQIYHFGMVARFSSVAGMHHWVPTYKAVPEWVADQRDKGLTVNQITSKLTKHGYWRADEPNAGLAILMPELGAKLNELGGLCQITIEPAPTNPAAVAGVDWMPAKIAQWDIKYCMRITCPSPVRWDAPPSALLVSSHPTRNRYWIKVFYTDIHANGVAATPGGYCTADGRLAKDFQG